MWSKFHRLGELLAEYVLALLAVALLLPFVGILLLPRGRVLGEAQFGDNPAYYFFAHDFVGRSLSHGELPLWNPHALLGFPQLAEGQAAIFHPLNLLYLVLPTEVAINWVVALSVVLTGIGCWWYLRTLGLGNAAASCAALVFPLSSRMAGRIDAGHLNMLVGFVSWPWMLGCWERYRATGRLHYLGYLALAYGTLIVAGYPQFTFIFSLFFLCYVVSQLLVRASEDRCSWQDVRATLFLGVFVIAGVGIAAAQLFPSIDFALRSSRTDTDYDFATTLSLPPESALTALTPTFFGTPAPDSGVYWGRGIFWETCLYVGIVPLVAAVVGVGAAPREQRAALLYTGLIFLVLGLGGYTPLFRIFYDYVPLVSLFRGPGKYSEISLFCLATLAGYGFQAMFAGFVPLGAREGVSESNDGANGATRPALVRAAACACAVVALACITLLAWYYPAHDRLDSHWGALLQWVYPPMDIDRPAIEHDDLTVVLVSASTTLWGLAQALLFACGAALLIFVCWHARWRKLGVPLAALLLWADLGLTFSSLLSTYEADLTRLPDNFADVFERHNFPARVQDNATGMVLEKDGESCRTFRNGGMGYGYTTVSGYAGTYLERYAQVFQATHAAPRSGLGAVRADWMRRFFQMLAVDYLICRETEVPVGAKVLARHVGRALIPLNPFFARARLLRDTRTVASPDEALRYITSFKNRPSATPVIETTSMMPSPEPLQPKELARITGFSNNRVEIDVWAAQPRVLLLAEMYDPHWHATVNGQSCPVMPANYLLRAVSVPAGPSKVVFEYVDPWFQCGAVVSVVSLLATLLLIVVSHRRACRQQRVRAATELPQAEPQVARDDLSREEPVLSVGGEIARWQPWWGLPANGRLLPKEPSP
ncbi:MAG: YfhO family protein [Pirellulales bacterium]|nr:YfhO family protein [Pirellulales bacterium]